MFFSIKYLLKIKEKDSEYSINRKLQVVYLQLNFT